MKPSGLALVLLCLVGLLSLPIIVKADVPSRALGFPDWSKYVVRNVTDTGTFITYEGRHVLVCDHDYTFTNYNFMILGDDTSKRVFFTVGILETMGTIFVCVVGVNPPPEFVVYQMKDLPNNADIVSVSRLFGQNDASFDLDGNGIINMRDISTAIRNFALLSP